MNQTKKESTPFCAPAAQRSAARPAVFFAALNPLRRVHRPLSCPHPQPHRPSPIRPAILPPERAGRDEEKRASALLFSVLHRQECAVPQHRAAQVQANRHFVQRSLARLPPPRCRFNPPQWRRLGTGRSPPSAAHDLPPPTRPRPLTDGAQPSLQLQAPSHRPSRYPRLPSFGHQANWKRFFSNCWRSLSWPPHAQPRAHTTAHTTAIALTPRQLHTQTLFPPLVLPALALPGPPTSPVRLRRRPPGAPRRRRRPCIGNASLSKRPLPPQLALRLVRPSTTAPLHWTRPASLALGRRSYWLALALALAPGLACTALCSDSSTRYLLQTRLYSYLPTTLARDRFASSHPHPIIAHLVSPSASCASASSSSSPSSSSSSSSKQTLSTPPSTPTPPPCRPHPLALLHRTRGLASSLAPGI